MSVALTVLSRDELNHYRDTYEFEGFRYGGPNVSFIVVDAAPGEGPACTGIHIRRSSSFRRG